MSVFSYELFAERLPDAVNQTLRRPVSGFVSHLAAMLGLVAQIDEIQIKLAA